MGPREGRNSLRPCPTRSQQVATLPHIHIGTGTRKTQRPKADFIRPFIVLGRNRVVP